MIKPRDYDTVQAATFGDAQGNPPAPGGHVVKILKAEMQKNDKIGEMLVLKFDIKEGSESDDYYAKKYETTKKFHPENAKWQGEFKQPLYDKQGKTSPFFKGMIHAIENSNPSYVFQWDERTLAGKILGLVFREEDYIGNDQQVHTNCKPAWACDAQSAADMPIPKKKGLKNKPVSAFYSQEDKDAGLVPADDEKLPWDN